MHESETQRVADFQQAAKLDPEKNPMPDNLTSLPDETHIVTGSLVGHGATALASDKAKLSAKVVKLERTADGGIDYQLAIFVDEPEPVKVEPAKPVEDPKFLSAVEYFVGKGLPDTDARKKVNQFGVERVLAAREKELDAELQKTLEAPKE